MASELQKRSDMLDRVDYISDAVLEEAQVQAPNSNFVLRGWDTTKAKVYIGALLIVLEREGLIKL